MKKSLGRVLGVLLVVNAAAVTPAHAAAGWTESVQLTPSDRWGVATARTATGVVLFGGCKDAIDTSVIPATELNDVPCRSGKASNETYTWNGISWTMKTPLHSPPARLGAAMTFDPQSATVVMFGGITDLGTNEDASQPGSERLFQDTWLWDGVDWTEVTPTSAPSERVWAGLATDGSAGKPILFGGCLSAEASTLCSTFSNATYRFDVTGGNGVNSYTWTAVCTACVDGATRPTARFVGSQMTDDESGTVVLFGGNTSGATPYLGDTWKWTGSSWTQLSFGGSVPAARAQGGMAKIEYDGQWRILLFAGGDDPNELFRDTWMLTLTGTPSWTLYCQLCAPHKRQSFGLSWSPADGKVVLFGGVFDGPGYEVICDPRTAGAENPCKGKNWVFSGA